MGPVTPASSGTVVQSRWAATLVDEWVRAGVTDAVVCPGKRSTLMATAIERHPGLRAHVVVDERSAAFFALGLGMATGRPTVLWCTSGTAVAELHPAVLEAHYARIPLLVCTADRPPEQHHVRDWQSMDQARLFGPAVRWQFDVGVADAEMAASWRSIAARSVLDAQHHPLGPGPVHLNVPIREPFSLEVEAPVPPRAGSGAWHVMHGAARGAPPELISALATGRRGAILAGRGAPEPSVVHGLAERLGWPVLAQHRSGARVPAPTTIASWDALLRSPAFLRSHRPDVVVRIGDPLLSRSLEDWAGPDVEQWLIEDVVTWQGQAVDVQHLVAADPSVVCRDLLDAELQPADPGWLASWRRSDDAARAITSQHLDPSPPERERRALTSPSVARRLLALVPDGSTVFCSTSMSVRDVEWFSEPRGGVRVLANRGVSGLDGITSTAMGAAVGTPQSSGNVLLTGDLGFLHDLNGMWAHRAAMEGVQLAIVVIDNDGGGIFEMFPVREVVGGEVFDRVLGTPQGLPVVEVVRSLGVDVVEVRDLPALEAELRSSLDQGGVRVLYVPTDRQDERDERHAVHRAIIEAIDPSA